MDDNTSQVNAMSVHHSSQQHDSNWNDAGDISQNASLLTQRFVNRTSSFEAIEKTILRSAPSSSNNKYDDESDSQDDFELKLDHGGDDEKATAKHNPKNNDNDKDKDKDNKNKIARTSSASFPVADESDDETEDENDTDSTSSKEINTNNTVSKFRRIQGGGNNVTMWSQILQPNSKGKKERNWKKYVIYSFNLWSRLSSLIDFFTDLVLLYKVMNVSKPNTKIMPLAISLFVSIVSPYILSYSSGVKLGM